MVHDIVLVLDLIPLLAEAPGFDRADEWLFLVRVGVENDLIVNRDDMVFTSPLLDPDSVLLGLF